MKQPGLAARSAVPALLGVAILLVACTLALVRHAHSLSGLALPTIADVLPLIALLSVPAAVGLAFASKLAQPIPSTVVLMAIFAVGLIMRIAWFGAPAPLETDYHRYLWDGAVLANGTNPYATSPTQVRTGIPGLPEAIVQLSTGHLATLERINFPDLTTIYPGFAQLVFGVGHWLAPFDLDGLRGVFLLFEMTTFGLMVACLRQLVRPVAFVALYWCNPFVVFVTIGTAHIDAVLPPLLLGAFMAMASARPALGAGLLGLAVGTKLWPVLLAPVLVRRMIERPHLLVVPGAVFGTVTAVTVLPLAMAGLASNSGLAAFAANWHSANAFFEWLSYAVYLVVGESDAAQRMLRVSVGLLAVALIVGVTVWPVASMEAHLGRLLAISAIMFYCSPAQFPWYAVWFLAPAAVLQCWPLLLASVTLPSYYLFFPLWESGRGPVFSYGVAFIHSLPVFALLLIGWLTNRPDGQRRPHVVTP